MSPTPRKKRKGTCTASTKWAAAVGCGVTWEHIVPNSCSRGVFVGPDPVSVARLQSLRGGGDDDDGGGSHSSLEAKR